ncbi:penicillin-insensitive murein endopeptidase [Roseibium sp. RKSG952]|nr:penicillin-insensitive murein endopeptidase [Roseibium sp. RKSG952]MTI00051.1 penicillin-insensitive murein endopeptidase [Roseibium sp. RKSG952]
MAMLSFSGDVTAQSGPAPTGKPVQTSVVALEAVEIRVPVPGLKPEAPEGWSEQSRLVLRSSAPAKSYFGAMSGPAPLKARAIGSYAKGCLAGGAALPVDGPNWQAMRLSRNRNWGHPELIDYLQDLARDAPSVGWRGLLVGDLAQPRGGPMTSGHSSHQIGLDADIWLTEMPARRLSREQREKISAISMLKGPLDVKGADRRVDGRKWTDTHARLIRRAAQDKRVARIFVNPTIKKALCKFENGRDRSWLRKVRPWWGHHYHFHVRLACPKGSRGCVNQKAPPPGDGCGAQLTYWLSDEPWVPKKPRDPNKPVVKKRPLALAALPKDCRSVLQAE